MQSVLVVEKMINVQKRYTKQKKGSCSGQPQARVRFRLAYTVKRERDVPNETSSVSLRPGPFK